MFRLFSQKFLRGRRLEQSFQARSAERDATTDRSRVGIILNAIDRALSEAEREQSGLSRRVEDVLARAAVTAGNAADEYVEREAHASRHQDLFDSEVANGQRRLKDLAMAITHFKFLKAATLSRFPDYRPESAGS